MGKTLLGLALLGAGLWLFKSKKGGEIRKQVGDYACDMTRKMRSKMSDMTDKARERLDAEMA